MTIKDLARLDPSTVKLWNGEKWTQLRGISKSGRLGNEVELVLRSGERISCTPSHKFPTDRGLVCASEIKPGDVIESTCLPEPEVLKDCAIDEDAAWLIGLYIAEGCDNGSRALSISGHVDECERWQRVQTIAAKYGGTATRRDNGNKMTITIYGRILRAIIEEFVSGRSAKTKHLKPVVWRYSNSFLDSLLDGYLHGDAAWDEQNNRHRLGFTRNYDLESDLRTLCARLGYQLTLNMSEATFDGQRWPIFRGEIRKTVSEHHNCKPRSEVVEIRKARARNFYDLGVADDPHLFALASGVLTHNSKPAPMPESVTDRPTQAHEHIFLLAKQERYFYDHEAIKEKAEYPEDRRKPYAPGQVDYRGDGHDRGGGSHDYIKGSGRNKRSVWAVNPQPFKDAHFAVFPQKLIEPCILAGSAEGDIVLDPFLGSGTTALVANRHGRRAIGIDLSKGYCEMALNRCKQRSLFAESTQSEPTGKP